MDANTDNNLKCAPSKINEKTSCFSLESLKLIANKYNEKNNDKINIIDDKEILVKELEKRFSSSCSSHICWLRLDLIKKMNNDEILNNTFRPEGPKGKYDWLSTNNINEVIEQYHTKYKDFLFLGTVPYDFMELPELGLQNYNFNKSYNSGKIKLGLVINLDEHDQKGSHWVALYTNLKEDQLYYFDSVGKKPGKKIKKFINNILNFLLKKHKIDINVGECIKLIKKIKDAEQKKKYLTILKDKLKNIDIRYNNIQHQFKNTECGVYSINFILRLLKGETFDKIIKNVTKDDEVNKCREAYFNIPKKK